MNIDSTTIPARRKTSALSEFSLLSVGIILAVILLAAAGTASYIFMLQPPAKTYAMEDRADLLSPSDEKRIALLAKDLSWKKQINVIVVTTADKGAAYPQDDEGSAEFAGDKYAQLAHTKSFKDNSGVLLLLDMENRYIYVYTYGTAHVAVTNEECIEMTDLVVPSLRNGQYADAFESLISQISYNDFFSGTLVLVYALRILGPLVIITVVLLIAAHRKRNKITTDYYSYLDMSHTKDTGDQDVFDHKTVTVTTTSSSSGFSGGGGGGGFSGGGGGGGHSGGGGSHF